MAPDSMARRLLFALAALLGALLLLELAARSARALEPGWFEAHGGQGKHHELAPSEELLWRFTPGHYTEDGVSYRINSLGLRGPLPTSPKPPGSVRILFLGDSSVFGDGVQERATFPHRTAALLEARWAKPVEAVVGAVPGYSSLQTRTWLARNLVRLAPDLVLSASLWSDAMPREVSDRELMRGAGSLSRGRSALWAALRHSALFVLLEARLTSAGLVASDREIRWARLLDGDMDSQRPRVSPAGHADNLQAICAMARGLGAGCALLILPDEDDLEGRPKAHVGQYRDNYKRLARQLGVPLVDMPARLGLLSAAAGGGLFLDGLHPSARGHELIARALSEALQAPPGRAGGRGPP